MSTFNDLTPGPWRVERHENKQYPDLPTFHVLAPNEDAGKQGVSYSGAELSVARDLDSEADAHLIAAAPELLEELQAVAAWLIAPDLSKETLKEVRANVRAAIAKAEGYTMRTIKTTDTVTFKKASP